MNSLFFTFCDTEQREAMPNAVSRNVAEKANDQQWRTVMHSVRKFLIWGLLQALPVIVAAQGMDTTKIDQALGRSGQKTGDVYKVGFPRTDLHVSVHGLAIKPGLALGSWAAFTGTDDQAMVRATWFCWRMR
jgi:hypothetical protein